MVEGSVADADPSDPYVFGPPVSGSEFRGSVWIRTRILLSTSKNRKKNLDSYCFVTSFDFISLKNDVPVPVIFPSNIVISRTAFFFNFVGVLKVNDESSGIRIH
jgi:hypothetical protein